MEFIDDRFVLIRRDSDKLLFNQRYSSHNAEDGYEHDESGTGDGDFGITSVQGEPEATPTISWVLEKAEAAVKRCAQPLSGTMTSTTMTVVGVG